MKYQVRRAVTAPALDAAWDSPDWNSVPVMRIVNARPESSAHRPVTECKLQYTDAGFFGLFQVQDRYVRCVAEGFNSQVCRDSCVEFFVATPLPGYFNLEMNCGGKILLYYVKDNTRIEGGFKDYTPVKDEWIREVRIFHTLPEKIDPEQVGPVTWRLGFHLPFDLLRHFGDFAAPKAGDFWRANVYKCGDKTSHPHWLSWNPVRALNFHLPEDFGVLEFL